VISVITITYNNLAGLKDTLNSVSEFATINGSLIKELVIVDNMSSDSTEVYLENFDIHGVDLIYHRESDTGVYDAMNKGVALANNDFVIFINSGDSLLNSIYEEDIRGIYSESVAGVAFSCLYSFGARKKIIYPRKVKKNFPRLPGLHQGMLYKRKVLIDVKYDVKFEICGDFDNVCRIYALDCNNTFLCNTKVISALEAGGISTLRPRKLFRESTGIVKRNTSISIFFKLVYHVRLFFKLVIFQCYYRANQAFALKIKI